ncbi:hypothetical protein [Dechloromonas denitrificans]|uniref:hypothetical protein n=1 Tax=Dechloromonas denitrificans TaxID=281362 RepID=UPI001CF9C29D|nr:hypothetical protein [Dechloromonas denitrificans]UCV07205.1 hypothetical protein KI615_17640 [Dechloromonas denitrificans]
MSTYPEPRNEIVAHLLRLFDERQREAYEERAGILEFNAGLSRDHAECMAILDVIRREFILTKRSRN